MTVGVKAKDGRPVTLKPATMADADRILVWQAERNSRHFSRNPEVPSREEHFIWMSEMLNRPNQIFYIILIAETPAGMIRLDPPRNGFQEVSILVSTEYRGLGIARIALQTMANLVPNASLLAEIHQGNTASIRAFVAAGFRRENAYFIRHGKSPETNDGT